MNLVELGEKRKNFIKDCLSLGMSHTQAMSEDNWKRFKHYCETGVVLDPPEKGLPLGVKMRQSFQQMEATQ